MTGRTGGATTGRVARELQPHGTTARAQGRRRSGIPPCHCEPCTAARRRYQNRRQALTALGHPGIVPAAPAARHVRALADAGATWQQIRTAAGISQGTLASLLRDDVWQRTVTATTQERVLAVPLPAGRSPGERRVDGAGTRRRLRALQRAGWSCAALAQRSPVPQERLRKALAAGRVTVGTRDAVAVLFARLRGVAGPSLEVARRAERKGWVGPQAWEFADIDDPAASPDPPGAYCPQRSYEEITEDALFVLATAGPMDRAAVACRLGVQVRTLDRAFAFTREHSAT